jgi:predicted GNAT superfamily acetyltransferase
MYLYLNRKGITPELVNMLFFFERKNVAIFIERYESFVVINRRIVIDEMIGTKKSVDFIARVTRARK